MERKSIERVDIVFTISHKDFIMIQNLNNALCRDTVYQNEFLSRKINLYYRYNYVSKRSYGGSEKDRQMSEDIRTLKNQFCNESFMKLQSAAQRIEREISVGLGILLQQLPVSSQPYVIVAVPRSKADFCDDQLYLIKAISNAASQHRAENGAYFIQRHTDTKTTHLMHTGENRNVDMNTTGDAPYPGITERTCSLNGDVRGKNVILIDDIYTQGVGVDEDCAQFLFNNGARNVVLYTLCKT